MVCNNPNHGACTKWTFVTTAPDRARVCARQVLWHGAAAVASDQRAHLRYKPKDRDVETLAPRFEFLGFWMIEPQCFRTRMVRAKGNPEVFERTEKRWRPALTEGCISKDFPLLQQNHPLQRRRWKSGPGGPAGYEPGNESGYSGYARPSKEQVW